MLLWDTCGFAWIRRYPQNLLFCLLLLLHGAGGNSDKHEHHRHNRQNSQQHERVEVAQRADNGRKAAQHEHGAQVEARNAAGVDARVVLHAVQVGHEQARDHGRVGDERAQNHADERDCDNARLTPDKQA